MPSNIAFEIDYDLAPEKIWRTLTDPELLARWLMPNNFRAELGAEFEFRAKPIGGWDGIARCKVLEIEAPRRLVYSWRSNKIDTVVRFDLEPRGRGTRLKFEQSGFAGVDGAMAKFFMGGGWKSKLRDVVPKLAAETA
jgi:uncharacterized protein YndB with AHSA1/START domain